MKMDEILFALPSRLLVLVHHVLFNNNLLHSDFIQVPTYTPPESTYSRLVCRRRLARRRCVTTRTLLVHAITGTLEACRIVHKRAARQPQYSSLRPSRCTPVRQEKRAHLGTKQPMQTHNYLYRSGGGGHINKHTLGTHTTVDTHTHTHKLDRVVRAPSACMRGFLATPNTKIIYTHTHKNKIITAKVILRQMKNIV